MADRPCRACQAPLRFVISESGSSIPLDAKPEKRWVEVLPGRWRMVDTFVSHFVTCPNRDEFRKKKGGA